MPAGLVDASEPVTTAPVSRLAFVACHMACLASQRLLQTKVLRSTPMSADHETPKP